MHKVSYYYKLLFFQFCARRSDRYKDIEELVSGAYWAMSALQGINLLSMMYVLYWLIKENANTNALMVVFIFPLLINYFIFLKNEKYKLILQEFSKEGVGKADFKSYGFVISYFALTLLFLAVAGKLYKSI